MSLVSLKRLSKSTKSIKGPPSGCSFTFMEPFYQQCEYFVTELWELRDELMVESVYTNEIESTLLLIQELFAENPWWDIFRQLDPKTQEEKTILCVVIVLLDQIATMCKDRMYLHNVTADYLVQFQKGATNSSYQVVKSSSESAGEFDECEFEFTRKKPNKMPGGEEMPVFVNRLSIVSTATKVGAPIQPKKVALQMSINDSASSFDESDEPQKPKYRNTGRRMNFPSHVREHLKMWLMLHQNDPFPTDSEKNKLCKETGLSKDQLNNWFINGRRRYLKP
jgi:hypothetical protein